MQLNPCNRKYPTTPETTQLSSQIPPRYRGYGSIRNNFPAMAVLSLFPLLPLLQSTLTFESIYSPNPCRTFHPSYNPFSILFLPKHSLGFCACVIDFAFPPHHWFLCRIGNASLCTETQKCPSRNLMSVLTCIEFSNKKSAGV